MLENAMVDWIRGRDETTSLSGGFRPRVESLVSVELRQKKGAHDAMRKDAVSGPTIWGATSRKESS